MRVSTDDHIPPFDVPLTQGLNHPDEVGEGTSEPIEFPHHERIARLECLEARREPGPRSWRPEA